MRIRGRQETSAAPNKLLLNGKVLLTKSLCNGNNHHPPQLSQYGFPFHILPHLADGFPIPILPNLNSFPEITRSTVLSEAVCSPPTPVTLDKNKRIQDLRGFFSQEVIDLVDGSIQGKQTEVLRPAGKEPTGLFFSQPAGKEPTGLFFSQPAGKEPTGLFFSKPVISELISFQQKEGETNVAISSEGVLLQQQETEEHGKREDQCIDLNKTPQQKPRRKKHRPKVIREGKPARTPKPVTPKPVTPKPARNKESPSGKRKYVRKNKVVDSDTPLSPLSEIVDADSRSGTKSVRRCLNFESEESQARNGCLGSPSRFSDNGEAQAKDVCISGVITSSIFKSVVPSAQGRAVAENTSAGITFDLNSSMKQTSTAVIGIPHTPTQPSQPSRRDTRINDVMNEFIRVANYSPPPPQTSRREIIQENLKKFAWNNEYQRIASNSDRSTETGQKSQLDPNNSADVLLRGTKRGHNLFDDEHISTFKNFMHANNIFDHISESHDTIVHGPFFPEVHKKMRVGEQNEVRSIASSLTTGPSSGWKTSLVMPNNGQESTSSDAQKTVASSSKTRLVVPNNCKVFRFSDAQRLMALEKLRASQHMLPDGQRKIKPDNTANVQVRADNLTSLCVTKDCNNMSTPVKPSFFNSTDCNHLSTPKMVRRCNDSQGSWICEPQTSIEALSVNNNVKLKSKTCTEKEQTRLVKPMPLNTNQMRLQDHDVASSSYVSSVGQKFVQISASASGNSKDGNSRLRVSSLEECENSSNFKESLRGISPSVALVPYGDPVDDVVWKLKCLNINAGHEIIAVEPQKALVPYGGGSGMVVPYEGPFDLTRKRRPRPKVDLDPETNRVWKLLMGKEGSNEGIDMNKEKWWEEERRIFRGRVDSFIARMHLVQGDRRFSRWKGSVVDSVVGVFLTQNVSDHLSSSAYMALAARFPLRPKGDSSKPNAEKISSFTEQQDGCIIDIDDRIKWQEKMLGRELCSRGSLVISEAEQIAQKEIANSDQLLGSNTGGSKVNYSKPGGLDFHGELEIGHESAISRTGTPDTMTSSDRKSMEDVVSSQSSVVSSQNSSEFLVQTADQVKLSSSPYVHAEDMLNGAICNGLDSSSSFMELLQLAESTRFQELYSHGNERVLSTENSSAVDQLAHLEVDKRTPIADRADYLNGKCSPMYRPNPHPQNTQHGFTSVSCAPSPSYHLYSSLNSTLVGTGNVNAVREGSIHLPSTASGMSITSNIKVMNGICGPSTENPAQVMGWHNLSGPSFPSYNLHNSSNPKSVTLGNSNAVRERSSSQLSSTASVMNSTNNIKLTGRKCGPSAEKSTEAMGQHGFAGVPSAPSSSYHIPSFSSSRWTTMGDVTAEREESSSHLPSTNSGMNKTDNIKMIGRRCGSSSENSTGEQKERGTEFQVKSNEHSVGAKDQIQNGKVYQTSLNSHDTLKGTSEVVQAVESNLKDEAYSSQKVLAAAANSPLKAKRVKSETEKNKTYEWDNLRKQACPNGVKKERSSDALDSLDWEAIRCADVNEISQTIRERGMNNLLAERIKDFLNRLVRDHGSIDLEWLRDVPPDAAKDYLLSIRGLGLKSVECVRLLTLHHLAFPVDTNVGRICVRLGWVPLQPLPESLQIHLLEMYPILETIQKYLWPRLCKLDQRTLYELHYQLITFGKVFCTKSKPNCNACPMRGECKHFASAFASSRLALPGPEEKGLMNLAVPIASKTVNTPILNPFPLPQLEGSTLSCEGAIINNCEPIIEEPATPEPEFVETTEREIEDAFYEDPDEIPHIELNLEEFSQNLQNYMQENNMDLQDGDMSKALVAITPEAASIPMPKLKNVSHLRTEHQVYELRDSHPLLEGMDQREPDDPSPYLLAIWSPGETAQSTEPPKVCCDSQDNGKLCEKNTCFACNSVREAQSQTVRGTILIPCRTAMRGSFPLNGTYFQVNEVFADHDSSCTPIHVPREWIWNLPRRTVYFGTSIPTIFKGLTTEGIQHCFWRGFVCVRGFDRTTRAPKPLYARLHFPASKVTRNKTKAAASAAAREEE